MSEEWGEWQRARERENSGLDDLSGNQESDP